MTSTRVASGQLLIATGVLHQVVGVMVGLGVRDGGRNRFAEIADLGVVNSIAPDFARMALFWFLLSGFLVLILGSLMHHVERRGMPLPRSLGWQMGGLGIVGVVFLPVSGFWLVLPQAWWILRKARR